jgi:hypothetical protein
MPGRHDPEFRGDVDRRELRLRQAHPVLVRHRLDSHHPATREKVLRRQHTGRVTRQGFGGKQRHDARTLPARLGRRHVRLAKQRLLSRRLRVGVFHRHAERIQRVQRLAQGFDFVDRGQQDQFKHGSVALVGFD